MKAFCLVQENELGIFENISSGFSLKNFTYNDENMVDDFDFDNNSIEDFLEYLDFQEVEEYIFISTCYTKRLLKFVLYLARKSQIKFSLIDFKEGQMFGENSYQKEVAYIFNQFRSKNDSSQSLSSTQLIENSLYSIYTGIYPGNYKKDLIKHIFLEDGSLLNSINNNLYDSMSINGAFYIYKNSTQKDQSPNIFLEIPKERKEENRFIEFSDQEFKKEINTFISTGRIKNTKRKKGIIDNALKYGEASMNRLLIFKDGIYLDYMKTNRLSEKLNLNSTEIQMQVSSKKTVNDFGQASKIYSLLYNFVNYFSSDEIIFITPYSIFKIDNVLNQNLEMQVIGLIDGDKNYIYNLRSAKLFEVNTMFLEFLEADLKNSMNLDYFKKNYSPEIYENTLKEYMEVRNLVFQ